MKKLTKKQNTTVTVIILVALVVVAVGVIWSLAQGGNNTNTVDQSGPSDISKATGGIDDVVYRADKKAQSGDVAGAAKTLKQAASQAKDNSVKANYYTSLSAMYVSNGQNSDAIKAAQKAVELTPTSYMAHANLGAIYKASGDKKNALNEYKKALAMYSKNKESLRSAGNVNGSNGPSYMRAQIKELSS